MTTRATIHVSVAGIRSCTTLRRPGRMWGAAFRAARNSSSHGHTGERVARATRTAATAQRAVKNGATNGASVHEPVRVYAGYSVGMMRTPATFATAMNQ